MQRLPESEHQDDPQVGIPTTERSSAVKVGASALLVTLSIATMACDRQTDRKVVADGAVDGGSATSAPEVEAYLKQFSGGDPEACFEDVKLAGATFRDPDIATGRIQINRVIIAIDASGSMAGRVSSRNKLDLAKTAAAAFVEELPGNAEAGLLVFGQAGDNSERGKARSCNSVDLTVPLTRDRSTIVQSVSRVRAIGWTPLASALKRAEALLATGDKSGEQVIYVVSDGQETCGGDPIAAARAINQGATKAIVNIIGFAVPKGEAASLAAVAAAGGGRFVNAGSDREVDAIAARIREDGRRAANAIRQSGTIARNNLATSGAEAKARLCTSGLIARERLAIAADLSKKRMAGQDVALEERAEKLMNERHSALERRAKNFAQAAEIARDTVNDEVNSNAAMTR